MPFIDKSPDYIFQEVNGKCLKFQMRTGHSGRLALTVEPAETNPIIEIVISDTTSLIRKNRKLPNIVEVSTPEMFRNNDNVKFWIRWTDQSLAIGYMGESTSLMTINDEDLSQISYIGLHPSSITHGFTLIKEARYLACGRGENVSNRLSVIGNGLLTWVPAADGVVPPGAIEGGIDNREKLYVARALHMGSWTPGKLHPAYGNCYVAWGGREHTYNKYEVLCFDNNALTGSVFNTSP